MSAIFGALLLSGPYPEHVLALLLILVAPIALIVGLAMLVRNVDRWDNRRRPRAPARAGRGASPGASDGGENGLPTERGD